MQHLYQTKVIRFGNISFSEKEIKDLVKAWLFISLAFGILLSNGFNFSILITFMISALTVGVGFIAHELSHKVVAQRYGAWAEFRSWDQMLYLAVIMSFFGFVLVAPGAVLIQGKTIGKSRNGKISAAGPLMNFIMAIIFLLLTVSFTSGIMQTISNYGFFVNTWLGLFNMIPFGMLDGKKILTWNKTVFGTMVGVGIILISFRYFL